ncbi:hypothetical protein ACFL96_14265 [Thermoproteota archaeon]
MKSEVARALKFGEFLPVMKPTYATPDEVLNDHGGNTYADVKHDGYRIQIHKTAKKRWMFTANGKEYNYQCYPDIEAVVEKLPTGIFEAELVGDGEHHKKVFDKVKKRFRRSGINQKSIDKYLQSGIVDEVPLSLMLFDVLKFERKGLLYTPFSERKLYREKIDESGITLPETRLVESPSELGSIVDGVLDNQGEGIVCKGPSTLYKPGSTTTTDWVKFKRAEPLDLVIVGFYLNEEYANGLPFTSVLCATYNNETDRYETIGKVGVTRNAIANEIGPLVAGKMTNERPSNVAFSEKLDQQSFAKFVPDTYIQPEESVVLEVKAMNLNYANNWHTCGLDDGKAFSMRIGFAEELRYDKNPDMATKTSAVRKLYEVQEKGVMK